MITPEFTLGIAAIVIPAGSAGLGWMIKKIVNHDQQIALTAQAYNDLKELINTRFDASDQRVSRIERSLNGHLTRD